ncbi:MAG: hypothetical protein KAQ94_01130 [Arcobacteraceae bacterium]|nr:hypothetical protein [Arcobacteraceae bacterium]
MTLLLISKTAIIKQIFNLVSTKLNIELTTLDICVVNKNYDLIIVEDVCLDDSFPTSDYTKSFGIITKEDIDNLGDFVIPKPFLPSALLSILQKQIQLIKIPHSEVNKCSPTKEKGEDTEITDSLEFIETLADDICDEIVEESDESIVEGAFVKEGGILDSKELSKIQNMLDYDTAIDESINISSNNDDSINNDDEKDWIDLSNIIDKAIDEAREYKFDEDEPIKLMLNKYSMNEISPLLNKLGQNIVDELTNGKEITLKLKVEKSNE